MPPEGASYQYMKSINISHLQKRMEQSEKWDSRDTLTIKILKEKLAERFHSVDFDSARADVEMFLSPHDRESLAVWDAAFFEDITDKFLN